MNFCIQMYDKQVNEHMYLLHEHPWSAWSWQLPAMRILMERGGVQ